MINSFDIAISFIIPVYNGAKTILRCLDSIYSISFQPWKYEIIVVDDCSTDNTIEILKNQQNKHANLTIIPLATNSKPGYARNRGLEQAKGEYIMFVDADDTINDGVVQALTYALETGVDLLYCRAREQKDFDGPFRISDLRIPEHTPLNGIDFCEKYYMPLLTGGFFHYLYKSYYLERIGHKFAEGVLYEDLDWVEFHLYNSDRIEADNSVIYSYYATQSSIIHTQTFSHDADKLLYCYRRLKFSESETIKYSAPRFSSCISGCSVWVRQILSFRHLTKYSRKEIMRLFSRIRPEAIPFFKSLEWEGFTEFCIIHPNLTIFFVSILSPVVNLARLIHKRVVTIE